MDISNPNPLAFLEPGAVALLITYLAVSIVAFAKGWVVPRFIYDRSEQRYEKVTEALEHITKALDSLTDEVRLYRGDKFNER